MIKFITKLFKEHPVATTPEMKPGDVYRVEYPPTLPSLLFHQYTEEFHGSTYVIGTIHNNTELLILEIGNSSVHVMIVGEEEMGWIGLKNKGIPPAHWRKVS